MDFRTDSEGRLNWLLRLPLLRRLVGFCFFEIAFYFAYYYGMSFSQACACPFWFPDTVLLCALLLSKPRNWWVYIVATLPIRLFCPVGHDNPEWFLFTMWAIGGVKNIFVAAALRLFLKNTIRLDTLKEFALFSFFAVLLGPVLSAFAGAAVHQVRGGADYWTAWSQWFMGNALTHLVVTPAILYWLLVPWRKIQMPSRAHLLEGCALAAGLIVTSWLAFSTSFNGTSFAEACMYAPVPFLFWSAIRFGMPGASGAIAIITFFSVNAAIHYRGPFLGASPEDTALALQEFLLLRAAPLYLVAILIRQRKSAEESLRESEERFRIMADTSPALLWMTGADKRCSFVNRSWLDFTGRTMEEELGDGWEAGVHPEDLQHCLDTYHSSFDTRQPFEMEYRIRRHDGEYRWMLDRGIPRYGAEGEFLGYIGSAVDLTDRKRAEETRQNLIHASRLAILGELTAMIAHELSQPLTAILSNTEAVERILLEAGAGHSDEIREILADIREDDLRASDAIRRIRTLVSRREMEMKSLDANAIVSEVVRLARGDAERRHVQIHEEYSPSLPQVRGDEVHLQHVLLNLIVNGMDAMKDNPESERHLIVSTSGSDVGFVEVAVKDIGQGVPPENLPRVFDSFFTTKPEGMGIGLSLARHIIQLHSGRMWVENNRDGKGTTFRFIVPAVIESSTSRPAAVEQPAAEYMTVKA